MNPYVLLFAEALISGLASVAVLSVLAVPLGNALRRICPDEQSADFWISYTKLMLTIAPLLLVLTVDLFTHFSSPLDSRRIALLAALGGLLVGLNAIGKRLGRYVAVPAQPGSAS